MLSILSSIMLRFLHLVIETALHKIEKMFRE